MTATTVAKADLGSRLFGMKEAGEVEELLQELPGKVWRPLGGMTENLGPVHAIADSADALVERVTNCFDAVIEREVLVTGRSNFQTPRQAVEALIGIPGGRLSLVARDDDTLRPLARQVMVTVRDSGVEKHPTMVVLDRGMGQHPSAFPETLVSLNKENKRKKLYLMGAYGFGGAASVGFSKYTLFLSRRDRRLLEKGQKDEVGWTVVRYNPEDDDIYSKHGLYEYLCLDAAGGPRIPSFAPEHLPAEHRDWTGTQCTLIEYELSRFNDSAWRPDHSAYLMFNAILFDPIFPMLIRDEREKAVRGNEKSSLDGLVVLGTATRLARDTQKRIEYQNSYQATLPGDRGSVTIRYAVLNEKGDPKKDWEPFSTYVLPEQAVTVTHNGQRQGSWRRELFTQLGLISLAKFMIVQVDCDSLSWRAKKELFTATRDRLKDSDLAKQLRDLVATALQSDRSLSDLDRRRKENALGRRTAQHAERIKKMLQRAIDSMRQGVTTLYRKVSSTNHDLPVFGDQPLVQAEPRGESDGETTAAAAPSYPEHPTEFRVVNPIVQVPAGGKAVVKMWMNAQDGYIAPGGGVGAFAGLVTKGPDQFRLVGYSALRAGNMRCTISAEAGAIGDQGRVVFTVVRPGQPPLIDEADLVITEPPVLRAKPVKKGKGPEPGPNFQEVYREQWNTLDFDEKRVARVEHNFPGPGETTIYVNWDYPPLDAKLLAERKASGEDVDPYKQKFCASMALAAWLQDSDKDAEPLSQEARDAELRRAADVFLFSQFVSEF